MLNDKTFVAVIPARGGSKGIKDKNIVPLKGKPLIWYCIDAAQKSGIFDRIVVSTDSPKIKDIVELYGIEVIDRPEILAQDGTPTELAVTHALEQLDETYDYVQLIEATAPLVTDLDFIEAANYLIESKADLLLGVCRSEHQVIFPIGEGGSIRGAYPKEIRRKNRQSTPQMYFINGCIYVGKWDVFYEGKDFYDVDVRAFKMPQSVYCDINYRCDLVRAEAMLDKRDMYNDFLTRRY